MGLLSLIHTEKSSYVNQEFEKSSGIYFEHLSELQFYSDEQHIFTYLNLDAQEQKQHLIKEFFRETDYLCDLIEKNLNESVIRIQKNYMNQLSKEISQVEIEKSNLHQLLGHSTDGRKKRGWFNIVGKVAKELFGVMDTDDAEFIDSKINEFDYIDSRLTNLIKDQSYVVKTTIINFNSTISSLVNNEYKLRSNIVKITDFVNKLKSSTVSLEIQIKFDEHLILMIHLIENLKNEYSSLINAVLLARKGILHPSIMSPVQLQEHLKEITPKIPSGLELPVPLEKENAYLLLNVIDIVAYFYSNKLVFKISIPLLPNHLFDIYNCIPIPVKMTNSTYVFISPNQNKFVVRKDKHKYTFMTNLELGACKKLLKRHICQQQQPLKSYTSGKCCELSLLLPHTSIIPDECEKRVAKLESDIWNKLSNKNSWIYILGKPTTISMVCGKNPENYTDILLKNHGVLSLPENCKAYSKEIILSPSIVYSSKVEKNYSPKIDLCEEICNSEKISQLNATLTDLGSVPHIVSLNTDDLKLASLKLDEIENLATQINFKKILPSKDDLMFYIIVILSIIIMVYIIFKCCCPTKAADVCCRLIPNICIRINNRQTTPIPEQIRLQAIEDVEVPADRASPNQRRYVTRSYTRNQSRL